MGRAQFFKIARGTKETKKSGFLYVEKSTPLGKAKISGCHVRENIEQRTRKTEKIVQETGKEECSRENLSLKNQFTAWARVKAKS